MAYFRLKPRASGSHNMYSEEANVYWSMRCATRCLPQSMNADCGERAAMIDLAPEVTLYRPLRYRALK